MWHSTRQGERQILDAIEIHPTLMPCVKTSSLIPDTSCSAIKARCKHCDNVHILMPIRENISLPRPNVFPLVVNRYVENFISPLVTASYDIYPQILVGPS